MKRIVISAMIIAGSVVLATAQPAKEAYEPGLGEFMTATQLRHAKLWFAGKNRNWPLAAYEIDEIKEGLQDATKLHATHEGIPVADMIKMILDPKIEQLEKAIEAKDIRQFVAAFDELTDGCNSCHAKAGKPYIRIRIPSTSLLSNQDFAPPR
jgi:hypothetical protein